MGYTVRPGLREVIGRTVTTSIRWLNASSLTMSTGRLAACSRPTRYAGKSHHVVARSAALSAPPRTNSLMVRAAAQKRTQSASFSSAVGSDLSRGMKLASRSFMHVTRFRTLQRPLAPGRFARRHGPANRRTLQASRRRTGRLSPSPGLHEAPAEHVQCRLWQILSASFVQ